MTRRVVDFASDGSPSSPRPSTTPIGDRGVDDVEARVTNIERALLDLSDNVDQIGAAVVLMRGALTVEDGEDFTSGAMTDPVWSCKSCGRRLGIYDPENDELRLRHKQQMVYIKPGIGGHVVVPCRGCSRLNEEKDLRAGFFIDAAAVFDLVNAAVAAGSTASVYAAIHEFGNKVG